ncbi:MAG: VTT domain-containing protein [Deltaproteobacteria bacterium]|nr:VTT domain-containing protein [Deltaproteobacteria bacterium]
MEPGAAETTDSSPAGAPSPEAEPVKVEIGPPPSPRGANWPRLAGLAALTVALFAIGHFTGLTEHLSRENLRSLMESLGVWGVLLFVVLFAVGEFMHVPGIVFVLAALLAYGRVGGAIAAYAGALVSVSFAFVVVRRVGGQALADVRRAWLAKVLAKLDERPILTVAVLRIVFFLAPALNYGLAMTRVSFRDFFVGSALGLLPPVITIALAFEWALTFFE